MTVVPALGLSACTAINMQSYYKLKDAGSLVITDSATAQTVNPTPPAYFVPFSKEHAYSFPYKNMTIRIDSPVKTTNKSTCLGPLVFPIFPVGITNHYIDPEHRPPFINWLEIRISDLDKNATYRQDLDRIVVRDVDSGAAFQRDITYPVTDNAQHPASAVITISFEGTPPRCYAVVFEDAVVSAGVMTQAVFCRVNRPSLSMGVW